MPPGDFSVFEGLQTYAISQTDGTRLTSEIRTAPSWGTGEKLLPPSLAGIYVCERCEDPVRVIWADSASGTGRCEDCLAQFGWN